MARPSAKRARRCVNEIRQRHDTAMRKGEDPATVKLRAAKQVCVLVRAVASVFHTISELSAPGLQRPLREPSNHGVCNTDVLWVRSRFYPCSSVKSVVMSG